MKTEYGKLVRITNEQRDKIVRRYLRHDFQPLDLSQEQQALVVEQYLGIHPEYMLLEKGKVKINYGKLKGAVSDYGTYKWRNIKKVLQ